METEIGSGAGAEPPDANGEGRHGIPNGPEGCCRVPFGPYEGCTVEEVAVIDAPWLADLVATGVGPAELRAAAARALLGRGRFSVSPWRSTAPWSGEPRERARATCAAPAPTGGESRAVARRWRLLAAACGVLTVALIARGVWHSTSGLVPPAAMEARTTPTTAATPRPAAPGSGNDRGVGDGSLRLSEVGRTAGTGGAEGALVASGVAVLSPTLGASTAADTCGRRVPGAVSADAAAQAVGSFQAVEFRVAATKDTGRVTYLNSRVPYQGSFYVAVFPGDYDRFPAPPAQFFEGRCIVVQGTIELYRGTPEIVLRSPDDVRILEDSPTP